MPLLLLLLPLLATALPTEDTDQGSTGILISGGQNVWTEVEFWSPSVQCTLPPLTRDMLSHTMTAVQGKVVACYWDKCDQFDGSQWTYLQDMLHLRRYHTAVEVGGSVLLMGGNYSP